ncbi:MAG: hypothetical protein COU47_01205 [Candidatus Niyogibacteria bacterium CG10_big_fil_rev_8_21_14_0_10_46_36]|uniref:Indoleamine 2,3-dioxygenase n=1 Tax=Candidatus Niyogibacteria bacterium CG10_big_fil_rev_8_21_14_0_10_46_36 TaxID=1974726 RepID=A0A2H0TE26_9BACT|nr:MAG: hypothetical protein COU47_01205 [Candidatus Niyogibacteria bacterium CG10_big_fil_rev_8_21_14_0_10_46_36]
MSETRGFLPDEDPIRNLDVYCLGNADRTWVRRYEKIAYHLPKLLVAGKAREYIERESDYFLEHQLAHNSDFDIAETFDGNTHLLETAMRFLSFVGNAYVWQDAEWNESFAAPESVPEGFARLWYQIAHALGRHPSLGYPSYALHNWYRLDPEGPIALGNIALLQNFLGGLDEEWFILPHVEIEMHAGLIPKASLEILRAAGSEEAVIRELQIIVCAEEKMLETLKRVPERCDPTFVYYNRVRPYIHGWKNNPALPKGLMYPGVEAYGGTPQQFRGETGAQSSIVPLLDAILGVEHEDNYLKQFLLEMRDYMPVGHRAFIEMVERNASLLQFVEARKEKTPYMFELYERCRQKLEEFRSLHLEYAHRYIFSHQQKHAANPTQVGTGGTPFAPYLKKHRDETRMK